MIPPPINPLPSCSATDYSLYFRRYYHGNEINLDCVCSCKKAAPHTSQVAASPFAITKLPSPCLCPHWPSSAKGGGSWADNPAAPSQHCQAWNLADVFCEGRSPGTRLWQSIICYRVDRKLVLYPRASSPPSGHAAHQQGERH